MLRRRNLLAGAAFVSLAPAALRAQGRMRDVRVGFSQDALTLDPANHRNRETQTIIRNIHDGLLTRDPDMRIVPEIADAWRAVDAKTYEFRLRPNIRFHSGDPLTAEDVAFTFNRLVKDGAMGGQTSPRKGLLGPMQEALAVDDRTVRFILGEPWPILPAMLPFQEVVNRRHVARVGQEGMQTRPDGCGPFRLVEWRRGEAIILERFDGYYGGSPKIPPAGPAQVDRVIFRILPENAARVAALLAGEVDIINELPPSAMRQVEANPNVLVAKVNGTRTFFVALNNVKAPFSDVRVRHALNHALDKQAIIARILNNTATPLRGVMSPDAFAFNPDLPEYRHDLARARPARRSRRGRRNRDGARHHCRAEGGGGGDRRSPVAHGGPRARASLGRRGSHPDVAGSRAASRARHATHLLGQRLPRPFRHHSTYAAHGRARQHRRLLQP